MLFNGSSLKSTYESFAKGDAICDGESGPQGFANAFKRRLGVRRDEYGCLRWFPTLEDGTPSLRPDGFKTSELAIVMLGEHAHRAMQQSSATNVTLQEAVARGPVGTPESAVAAVSPASFLNISAFYGAVSGLMQAKALAAFSRPEFLADRIFVRRPTQFRQEKMPGVSMIGDYAKETGPGEEYPFLNVSERFVTTPETVKHAAGIAVTKEAAFFDLTGEVLATSGRVGDSIALKKEKRCMKVVAGVTNPYVYGGVSYNTYIASGGNWVNKLASNALANWTNIDAVRTLASRATDQETGERVGIMFDTLLTSPAKGETAAYIANATEIERRTATTQAEVLRAANREAGRYRLEQSAYLEQALIDSGVTAANSQEYWFLIDSRNAFIYNENWAMDVKIASASDFMMASRGIVFGMFVDEMGVPLVQDPRFTFMSYNA